MATRARTPFAIRDDVDRIQTRVYRELSKLIVIAGSDRRPYLALRAAQAIRDLGALAGPPLAAIVEQIPSESRRLMLRAALREVPPMASLDAFETLMQVRARDPSAAVRAAAAEASGVLRLRSHERLRRLKAVDDRLHDLVQQECATGGD